MGLLRVGLPLPEALRQAAAELRQPRWRSAFEAVAKQVTDGVSVSAALEQHGKSLPVLYRQLVAAGERGGNLPAALAEATSHWDAEHRFREAMTSAWFYPVLVAAVGFPTIIGLSATMLPVFQSVYESFSGPPHRFDLLSAIRTVAIPFSVAAWLMLAAFSAHFTLGPFLGWWHRVQDRIFLHLPFHTFVMGPADMARTSRFLATLLSTGVPLHDALDLCAQTCGQSRIQAALARLAAATRDGQPLGDVVMGESSLPASWRWVVRMGEQKNALIESLGDAARLFDATSTANLPIATQIIEISAYLVIGSVFAAFLISVYGLLVGMPLLVDR